MNPEQLAAIGAALSRAEEIGGRYQKALLRVAVSGASAMRAVGMTEEQIGVFHDALAVLVAAPRPDPIELADNHTRLMRGLGESIRLLRDDQ